MIINFPKGENASSHLHFHHIDTDSFPVVSYLIVKEARGERFLPVIPFVECYSDSFPSLSRASRDQYETTGDESDIDTYTVCVTFQYVRARRFTQYALEHLLTSITHDNLTPQLQHGPF